MKILIKGHQVHSDIAISRTMIENQNMDEKDLEGTLVLEKLAEINKIEDFFDAIDSDDLDKAKALMKRANIDMETIAKILKMIQDGDD